MKRLALMILLLVAATTGLALAAEPVTQPAAGVVETPSPFVELSTITGIVIAAGIATQVIKKLVAKLPIAQEIPVWLYAVISAAVLTLVANRVIGSLQGDLWALLWKAGLAAATASGFYSWLSEPGDTPAKSGGVAVRSLIPFLILPLVLTSGCVGTQTLSPSQQYGIASASVRAAADSIRTAGENGLISDEDIIAIDPVVRQAFDSLRSMRTAILEGDPITVQWYLIQVQGLVSKLSTMQLRAKEMNDGSNGSVSIDSNHSGHQRPYGPDYRPARGERRQARLYARRTRNGRSAKRQERKRLVRLRRRREGKAGWRDGTPAPGEPLVSREVEWD